MPTFSLHARDAAWIAHAPVVMTNTFTLAASPDEVFEKLAAIAEWSEWYRGMKKVRIDGPARGVGALRTVWVGTTRVQEHFIGWEPGDRLTFALTQSNTPGIHSMVEDWVLTPEGPGTKLSITVGIEAARLLRPFPGLVRAALKGALGGAAGITTQFP